MSADILIIDDEVDIRNVLEGILGDEGYTTRPAGGADEAYARFRAKVPDLVILDIWLEGSRHDGMEVLKNLKKDFPSVPVLMISGHGTIETAVSALKIGAYDFIEKPFKADRLLLTIERALETAKLRMENQKLRARTEGPSELVGNSPAIVALRGVLARVAQTNSRVLITGEQGTGKDVAARSIHRLSQRANKPFMTVNCAILHPDMLATELFGTPDAEGLLEKANGGTLFLDEVADMPLETQGKIVRVLQEQRFQRIGSAKEIEVDVRIIASTNRDLQTAMHEGSFRQDLYYRLNVVPIEMPPLRDRPQDIALLAEYFAGLYSEQAKVPSCKFTDSAMVIMQGYNWPGNVRQLRNAIEWTMIMRGDTTASAGPDQLPPEIRCRTSGMPQQESGSGYDVMGLPLKDAREVFEKNYLESQIRRFGGNISKTAQFIGMERSALHRKMKQLGISPFAKHNIAADDDDGESAEDKRQTA